MNKFALFCSCTLLTGSVFAADDITFSPNDIQAWPTRSFKGETEYRVVEEEGTPLLQAQARQQASAKYLEREIDLGKRPTCTGAGAFRTFTRALMRNKNPATTTPPGYTWRARRGFCPGRWSR